MPANCQSKPTVPMKAAPVSWLLLDIVHFQPAGIDVAQQQIGFAGDAAEITDARELPIHADGADEGGAGELIVGNVIDLQSAGIGVAQDHVAFAAPAEIT